MTAGRRGALDDEGPLPGPTELRGRDAVLAQVSAALARARDGWGAVVAVDGEPGSGKTAVCRFARARALADGFRVIDYGGVDGEADLPMAALSALLRPLLDQAEALPAGQRRAIAAAVGDLDQPVTDRFALGAATLSLICAASERGPLLTVIDDAHWLDRPSVEALSFAIRRLARDPVVVLVAARTGQCSLRMPDWATRSELGGLTAPDVLALLADAGLPTAPDVAPRLVEATGGLPLAVLETADALSPAQRGGEEALPQPLPIGRRVTQAYRDRLVGLPPRSRRAVSLAAIAGSGPSEALLHALHRLDLTLDDLEAAEDLDVLTLDATGIRFTHPLVRAAALSLAAPATRRAMHRALADALPHDPERRARHLVAAVTGPDESVAATLEAAAQHAQRRGGLVAAAPILARAAALTPVGSRHSRRAIAAARALGIAGHHTEATRLARKVLDEAADPEPRLDATLILLELSLWGPQDASLITLALSQAERLAPRDPARALQSLVRAARVVTARGALRQADVIVHRAEELLDASVPAHVAVPARLTLGYTLLIAGKHSEARTLLKDWRPPPAEQFTTQNIADPAYPSTVQSLIRLGRRTEAEQLFGALLAACNLLATPSAKAYVLSTGTELLGWRGWWPQAVAIGEQAAALADQTGQPALTGFIWAATARIWAGQGEQTRCRAAVSDGLGAARTLGIEPIRLYALAALGLLELGNGAPDVAARVLLEADDLGRACGCRDPGTVPFGPDLVEALARAGRLDQAADVLAEHSEFARSAAEPWARATMARCAALLAQDRDEANALFAAALEQNPPDVPFDAARTRLCWGEHLRRNREIAASRPLLEQALATFNRLGAKPWANRAAAELRAAGQQPRISDGPALTTLSAQEMHCALAVSQGMTNREAAAALFVSPKTVEYHLAKVYTKLGITSRTQLTRLLGATIYSANITADITRSRSPRAPSPA